MEWICLNGAFLPAVEARIPISDRGFLFGDGVFTTIRVDQGQAEFLKAHLRRLVAHCQQLNIVPPYVDEQWIRELIIRQKADIGCWRLKIIITAGPEAGFDLSSRPSGQLLMTLKPCLNRSFSPCRLCLFPYPIDRPSAKIKTLAYLDRFFVSDYAAQKGYDDALVTSIDGYVLETAFANLFWTDGEIVWIVDPELPYLKGLFLTQLIEEIPLAIRWAKAKVEHIPSDSAVYICNSLIHIRPVIEVGSRQLKRYPEIENQLKKMIFKVLEKHS